MTRRWRLLRGWQPTDGDWWFVVPPTAPVEPGWQVVLDQAIDAFPDAAAVYADHGRSDGEPWYLPDWSPERFREQGYALGAVAVRADLVRSGLVRGAELYDHLLHLIESGATVVHARHLLAHAVAAPTVDELRARRTALQAHLGRVGIRADVDADVANGVLRIHRQPPATAVSVVIPTRGSMGRPWSTPRTFVVEAVRSIVERSTHEHTEFVVVADASTPTAVLDELRVVGGRQVVVETWDRPFNFSAKINAGVAAASGDLLLLLNDDTELVLPGSIDAMAALFCDPPDGAEPVGLVGADLRFEDGTVQHAGHVYPTQMLHTLVGWPADSDAGPQQLLATARECIGVTAAAAMTDRDTFERVGGFPEDLPLDFNDVEFSLRVFALGRRCVWTPQARWYHFEGRTRQRGPRDDEVGKISERWRHILADDPYYNPNLAPRRGDWLELPPRSQRALSAAHRRPSVPRRAPGE
jgi:hypothetical protein